MRKAFCIVALCLFVLFSFLSCAQDPASKLSSPAIRGNVSIPSGANVKGSDFFIRIIEGENAVYTGKVNADGSFVVEGLEETKTYSILLSTEELGEINTSSRDVSRDATSGYGGWLKNVTASINEQAGVGSVKVKPLGTIKGVLKKAGEETHYDSMVYIPGTSYMAVTDADGNYSIYNVPQTTTPYSLRCISITGDWLAEMINGVLLYVDNDTESPVRTVPEKTLVKNTGVLVGSITKANSSDHSNITVLLESATDSATGTTTTDGRLRITGIVPGTYKATISSSGYASEVIENLVINPSEETQLPQSIVLRQSQGRITGRIGIDGETDYSGVTVRVFGNGKEFSAVTESDGSYSISAAEGNYNSIEFSGTCVGYKSMSKQISLFANNEFEVDYVILETNHNYGLFEHEDSSCSVAGYNKYRCWNCRGERVEYLPLLEHEKNITENVPASCTEAGHIKYECSRCGQVLTEVLPANGHDWGRPEIIEAATCSSTGRHKLVCNTCGAEEFQTIEKLSHSWKDNGYSEGRIEYVCLLCGESKYATDSSAILNISEWGSVSLKPSVDPDTIKTLIIPSEIDGITVTSVFSNAFQDCVNITKIVLPETLVSIEDWAFAGCSGVTEIELPESLERIGEHAFRGCTSLISIEIPDGVENVNHYAFYGCSSLVSVTLPDSITVLGRECFAGCGFDRIYIPESVESIVCYAFCDNTSLKEILIPKSVKYMDDRPFMGCRNLETVYIESQTQPSGWISSWNDTSARIVWGFTGELHFVHTESSEWNTSSTYHWHVCTECGEAMTMAKHTFVCETTKQPTCTEKGVSTYTCSVCGREYTEDIPALGHDYVSEITVPATCTEKGERTYSCTRCDSSYTEDILSQHDYEEQITTPATCTADGQKTLTCSICGDSKTEVIPATGHSYKETVVPATCMESGIRIHRCENCGDSHEEEIEALGHNYVASITKQATCEEAGIKTFTCSRCGDTYTEEIAAYGHFFTSSTILQAATCFESGLKSSKCFRCGQTVTEEIPRLAHVPVFASDDANHWTECSLCGEILVAKHAHEFVEAAGDYVCEDCGYSESSLYYQVDDNGVLTPKDKSVLPTVVRIPSNINGKAVVSIGNDSFRDCTGITSLVISEGIRKVGENAFWYCTNIRTLSLPSSLSEIGNSSFRGLEKLENLTIPGSLKYLPIQSFSLCHDLESIIMENGVERLGPYAFEEVFNHRLDYVEIPVTVTTIEDYAFRQCYIDELHYSGTVSEWNTISIGSKWRDLSSITTVVCSDGEIELPNYDVDSDGNLTIIDKSLIPSVFEIPTSVNGKAVRGVGSDCFNGCSNLTELTIPAGVTYLGYYCLQGCDNLSVINGFENIKTIEYGALGGACPLIESLYAPNVEVWNDNCPINLRYLTISNKIGSIPRLYHCSNLEGIVFLGTVSEFNRKDKQSGWLNGSSVTEIVCSDGVVDVSSPFSITNTGVLYCYDNSKLPAVLEIPQTVDGIAVKTLSDCFLDSGKHFTSVVVPEGVTRIEYSAFGGCEGLEEVSLPSTLKSIGDEVFTYCLNLESVTIPGGVTSIGYSSFRDCESLSAVTIPDTVTVIRNDAFSNCQSLETITIPDSVTLLGGSAFANSGLVSIDLPNSVKTLEGGVFQFCGSLESITISGNITEIPGDLFREDTRLNSIMFRGTVAKWNSLRKGEGWNTNVPATKVVCIDGEVNI